jgi:small-conductance mechanosensitive channel
VSTGAGLPRPGLLKAAHEHPDVLNDPEPIVRFVEFGDNALIFKLYFWALIDKRWMAVSDLNFAIDKIFIKNNLEMAFPQMDIHIRSITKNGLGDLGI